MFGTSLRPEASLSGTLDAEALAARIPPSYMVKGLFCSRFVQLLGSDYAKLAPRLEAAPRDGRYLPFKDYPQADYTRIVLATAAKQFPSMALPEAVRRIARDDITIFSSSMFGKIVLSLIGDVRSTLHRVPEAYQRIAPGPWLEVEDLDARTARVTFHRYHGSIEYVLGQLEGIVLAFDRTPSVIVQRLNPETLAFDVTHGG
ncbi:MAG TPA: DUF2378 family protein [Polyangiales bacterium]|nr:DUF2378 family protein [Polyangiales bacterium]